MTRVYIADAKPEERSALRLLILDLKMEVVGEAADWSTALAKAPATRLDMLLVEWDLLPVDLGVQALKELRTACPKVIAVVLVSLLDARQQAALSAGADAFISKGETPERVAEHLRNIAARVPVKADRKSLSPLKMKAVKIFPTGPEDQVMNKDIVEGKWKQMRGKTKAWWGKLTDDDLDRAAGKFEVLTGMLQEKYGYTHEVAANEIDKRVTEFEAGLKSNTTPSLNK